MNIFIIIILIILCSILYRIGGKGGFPHAKLIRRLGCPAPMLAIFLIRHGFHVETLWLYILSYILSSLSLTTYHDYLAPDKSSENWKCWAMTGACYSLSVFPLLWCGTNIQLFILRTVALSLFTMIWSEAISWDTAEEIGRGILYSSTVLFL